VTALLVSAGFLLLTLAYAALRSPKAPLPPVGGVPRPEPSADDLRTAVHEAGHVLAAWACPFVVCIDSAEIHSQGGVVAYRYREGEGANNRWATMVIALAGIAGELSAYRRFRSGEARKDLERAKACAAIVAKMGEGAPPWLETESGAPPFDKMFRGLDPAEGRILSLAYAKARHIVRQQEKERNEVAALLLSKRKVTGDELEAVLGKRTLTAALGAVSDTFVFVI
jgi:ATP-dependent Zn protease